jgi:16S rRNA (guanine966-N2)-methyltransferase
MRIISGSLKGLRLALPAKAKIRPTAERVREALFSALGSAVCGVDALDLFAGTGSLGLEALSRGAGSVTMVEKDLRLARNLTGFCAGLKMFDRVKVLNMDAGKSVDYLSYGSVKFGLIFLDPPYDSDWISRLALDASFLGLLSPGGLIVVERTVLSKDSQDFEGQGLETIFSRKYGATMLEIFTSVNSELSLNLGSY